MIRQRRWFEEPEGIGVPGLVYVPEFINEAEEPGIVASIEVGTWTTELARRRQHHGIGYATPASSEAVSLPPWIQEIRHQLWAGGLFNKLPVQALVNEYYPGPGIAAHKDYSAAEATDPGP